MWQGWINFFVGIWLILSSFWGGSFVMPWNFWLSGIVVAVLGFWTYRAWQGNVNGILGIWLIFSGFVPRLISRSNLFIVGILIAIFALWRFFSVRKRVTPPA